MKKIAIIALILLLSLALAGSAFAQNKETKAAPANMVKLGSVAVILAPPEGLSRVDGQSPQADAYIKKAAPKLKIDILAVYAEPKEWETFVEAASAGKAAALPRFAMIGTTRKMAQKKFKLEALRKENRSYARWFEVAASNRPMAAVLTAQGNKKLKEILGTDLGFQFKVGADTKKIAETSYSVTLGARVLFKIFGQPADVYLTATSLGVGDKIVYLACFEKYGSSNQVAGIQAKSLAWRDQMNSLNAGQYKK